MTRLSVVDAGDPLLASSDDLGTAAAQVAGADLPTDQEPVRERLLALIAHHADASARSCRPGHLTGSALVVAADRTRTLLMLHRKLGRWFQPGGHADGDANLAAVALREASEETGIAGLAVVVPAIDVDVHRVAPPAEDAHLHFDLRHLVLAPPGAVEHANHESRALRWVTVADLDRLDPPVDDSTRRLVERGLSLARDL